MKRKYIILVVFIIIAVIIITVIAYNYIYQDHRNILKEKPEFVLNAMDLKSEISSNEMISEKKYLNKTIEVTGKLTDFNATEITIDDIIFCQLKDSLYITLKRESNVTIKGRFIGYDDLLEQVKLDQCTIIH